jgi:hypothetical protein
VSFDSEVRKTNVPRNDANFGIGTLVSGHPAWATKFSEFAFLEILIEAPALHLIHRFVEFRLRDRLVDETLAAPEFAEIPGVIFEFRRHSPFSKAADISRCRHPIAFSAAIERIEIGAQRFRARCDPDPPERMKPVFDDLAQPELFRPSRSAAATDSRLDLAVEQRFEAGSEAPGIDRLDVLERQIAFEPVRNVEVAAGALAYRYRNIP